MPIIKDLEGVIKYDGPASGYAGQDLSNTAFTSADVGGADFTGTLLNNCHMEALNFSGVDFSGADVSGVQFNRSSFTNCTFDGTTFSNTKMIGCTFNGSTFANGSFSSCDVIGCSFTGTGTNDFSSFNFASGTTLLDSSFTGVHFVSSSTSAIIVKACTFTSVDGLDIDRADYCTFSNIVNFNGVSNDYYSCHFNGVADSLMPISNYYDCKFTGSFSGSTTITGSDFYRCEIDVTGLIDTSTNSNETFYDMKFNKNLFVSGTTINSVTFYRCSFEGTHGTHSLSGVTVGSLTFVDSSVQGLSFQGAISVGSVTFPYSSVSWLDMEGIIPSNLNFGSPSQPYQNATLSESVVQSKNTTNFESLNLVSRVKCLPALDTTSVIGSPNVGNKTAGNATMVGCVLSGINTHNTQFSNGRQVDVDFGNSALDVQPGSSIFKGCSFQNALIDTGAAPFVSGSKLENCDLKGCDFSLMSSNSLIFRGCDLSFADFSGSNLSGASFFGCNVYGADFTGASGVDLTGSFEAPSSETVEGSVVWDTGTPYADTATSSSGVVFAVDLTKDSTYQFDISPGGGAEQKIYWVSPRQAKMWSAEGGSVTLPNDNLKIIQESTGTDAQLTIFAKASGYHYLYLRTGSYSSTYTITATVT